MKSETREASRFCLVLIENIDPSACEAFQVTTNDGCRKCEHFSPQTEAVCIGCGCKDSHACASETTGACFWIKVDRELRIGVCSECADHVAAFEERCNRARGMQ